VRLDAAGTLVPALAASWTNPDARTWRLELRPDVRFHDGWRFTAADVAWTLERGLAAP
jgi:peptide/nickel transport system substrate-binding protein